MHLSSFCSPGLEETQGAQLSIPGVAKAVHRKHLGLTLLLEAAHYVNSRACWESKEHSRVAWDLGTVIGIQHLGDWDGAHVNLLSNRHTEPHRQRGTMRQYQPFRRKYWGGGGHAHGSEYWILGFLVAGWSLKAICKDSLLPQEIFLCLQVSNCSHENISEHLPRSLQSPPRVF